MAGIEQRPQIASVESPEGEEYKMTFLGEGYISSDHDDGTFIASIPYSEKERLWEEYQSRNYTGDDPSFLTRDLLDMAGLFPKSWREQKVQFEILVKAKRISPYINPEEK